jgi:hypothetical protein
VNDKEGNNPMRSSSDKEGLRTALPDTEYATALQGTRPRLSPVVVRGDDPDPDRRLLNLAYELSPVISIMNRLGMTAHGYQIGAADEIHLYRDRELWDKEAVDRLEQARAVIRKAAGDQLPVLPNAMIVYRRFGIPLLGEDEVGELGPDSVSLISPSTDLPG